MRYIYLLLVFALISSCEKNTPDILPEPEKPVILRDSISFLINGKTYVFSSYDEFGIGNRQVNIKPSSTLIPNQDWAYETAGYYWYGEKDSILYDTFYGFRSGYNNITISFSKKYKKDQLHKGSQLYVPLDSTIFKTGKQSFAVDLNRENTTDGISIKLRAHDLTGLVTNIPGSIDLTELSTYKPGFSILSKTGLTNDIQSNSKFEITNFKKIDDKLYLVEAEFEVNLFDNNEKLYRLEKGFLRFKTSIPVINIY